MLDGGAALEFGLRDVSSFFVVERGTPGKPEQCGDVVAFRYGRCSYFLTVPSVRGSTSDDDNAATLAQDRIAHVLGMDAEFGMKVGAVARP